jgi:serine/threonine protein kinase
MGEVYRARDSRLGRDVAIKILPPVFTADPERVARFDREARVLAALNHPHIGAIYGIEEASGAPGTGVRALVLELVEGDTLADRLAASMGRSGRGLPVAEALSIARQIADGLDAAHERGVVHRDLKPANIKLTPDGVVKILDFGLAKGGTEAGSTNETTRLTSHDGSFMGTPAYMSPEQARGLSVDKRADIWAFGCVLFELLTGRPPFAGETIADVIAAILGRDPDWSALPPDTPPHVVRLLTRCLAKNPKRRLRDIGDALADLESTAPASPASDAPSSTRPAVQFRRLTDSGGVNESPAISPDGKMVVFVASHDGRRHLWILIIAGGLPLRITRDDRHHEQPRWVPDSSALIYFTPPEDPSEDGTLWEIPALGGPPRPIAVTLVGGDVSHAGDRIAIFQQHEGRIAVVTVARDGSDRRHVAFVADANRTISLRWSPDDAWLAFQASVVFQFDAHLQVIPSSGGSAVRVARASSLRGLSWLPDSSGLVFSSSTGSTLPYPPTYHLRVVGRDGGGERQLTYGDTSYIEPDVHASGRLVACRVRAQSDIWKIPCTGSAAQNTAAATPVTRQTGQVQTPSVSPDGREFVYLSDHGGHANLWVARTDGSGVRQITFERDPDVAIGVPVWSPAGSPISVIVNSGRIEVWTVRPDGRGLRQLLPQGFSVCWSRDGRWVYHVRPDASGWHIEKIPPEGGASVRVRTGGVLTSHAARDGVLYFSERTDAAGGLWDWNVCRAEPEDGPAEILVRIPSSRLPLLIGLCTLSPDGKWLALPLLDGATSNVWLIPTSGGPMIPVTDFAGRPTVITRQVSWSPDSREIFAAVAEQHVDVIALDGLL